MVFLRLEQVAQNANPPEGEPNEEPGNKNDYTRDGIKCCSIFSHTEEKVSGSFNVKYSTSFISQEKPVYVNILRIF